MSVCLLCRTSVMPGVLCVWVCAHACLTSDMPEERWVALRRPGCEGGKVFFSKPESNSACTQDLYTIRTPSQCSVERDGGGGRGEGGERENCWNEQLFGDVRSINDVFTFIAHYCTVHIHKRSLSPTDTYRYGTHPFLPLASPFLSSFRDSHLYVCLSQH